MILKFKWEKPKTQYTSGEDLYIKKIHVGGVFWDSTRSRDTAKIEGNYIIRSQFPFPKGAIRYYHDIEDGKIALENYITQYLSYLIV